MKLKKKKKIHRAPFPSVILDVTVLKQDFANHRIVILMPEMKETLNGTIYGEYD